MARRRHLERNKGTRKRETPTRSINRSEIRKKEERNYFLSCTITITDGKKERKARREGVHSIPSTCRFGLADGNVSHFTSYSFIYFHEAIVLSMYQKCMYVQYDTSTGSAGLSQEIPRCNSVWRRYLFEPHLPKIESLAQISFDHIPL